MKLDETILQSNTCIELIKYIKELYTFYDPIACEYDLVKDYEYIMRKTHKALSKRSRGYQITDMFNKEQSKHYKELERQEKLLEKAKDNYVL